MDTMRPPSSQETDSALGTQSVQGLFYGQHGVGLGPDGLRNHAGLFFIMVGIVFLWAAIRLLARGGRKY